MPTSTSNVKNACHPFSTGDYFKKTTYVLIHNGIITHWKAKSLYEEHKKLGIKYTSLQDDNRFNDSEALLWDFALTMEKKQKELKVQGSIAFICLAMERNAKNIYGKNKNDKIYFGRNSNPLYYKNLHNKITISSESKSSKAVLIESDKLFTYNHLDKILNIKNFEIPQYQSSHSGVNYNNTNYTYTPVESYTKQETAKNVSEILSLEDDELDWISHTEIVRTRNKIKETFNEYMEYADGLYAIAFGMVQEEITKLEEETASWHTQDKLEILQGVEYCLLMAPEWTETETQNKSFKDKLNNVLNQSHQMKTHLIGA
jgi:hypothetical protein